HGGGAVHRSQDERRWPAAIPPGQACVPPRCIPWRASLPTTCVGRPSPDRACSSPESAAWPALPALFVLSPPASAAHGPVGWSDRIHATAGQLSELPRALRETR